MVVNETKIYPLTNDIIFKAVYGREDEACKKALVALLNVILGMEDEKIVSVEIKNPMNIPDAENGKLSVLDIKCKTDAGYIIGVEMQVKRRPDLEKRIIYYQGKKIADSLKKSEEYASIKKVVSICIMVENMYDNTDGFHSIYRYKETKSDRELSDASELHFLQLSKIDSEKKVEEMSVLERYGLYLLYANDETHCELMKAVKSFDDEVIVMTEPILNYATADERIRQAADDREMALWDLEVDRILAEQEKQKLAQETDQAKQKLEQFEKKAEQAEKKAEQAEKKAEQAEKKAEQAEKKAEQARQAAVIKMKEKGMSPEDIAEIMDMPVEKIE